MSTLPQNLAAEQGLIGAALFDNEVVRRVSDRIRSAHFCEPFHQRLWDAIAGNVAEDKLADPVMMQERFKADPAFVEMGGAGYLVDLMDKAQVSAAEAYAGEVFDCWARRALIDVAAKAQKQAQEGKDADGADIVPFDLISAMRRDLEAVEHDAAPGDDLFVDAETVGSEVLAEAEAILAGGKPRGLRCGLASIDRRMGGLHPGDLIIGAGRPSMGKTAWMRNVIYGAAVLNPGHLFPIFSAEMDRGQIGQRALSALTEGDHEPIPYERFRKGTLAPMDLTRLHELRSRLPANVLIRDKGKPSVESIARAVWALKRRGPVGAIGIDYLQILHRPQARGRNEASVIGDMTSDLKALAKDARVAVILLSQLSRQVEQRDDKRPNLSDLRESGAIEQDADAVIFPFRPAYYLERSEPAVTSTKHAEWEMELFDCRNLLECICAKNRAGPIGKDEQYYDPAIDFIRDKT